MSHSKALCCAALSAAVLMFSGLSGSTAAGIAQFQERSVRKIPFSNKPIAEGLRPDDDIVIVEWVLADRPRWDKEPSRSEALLVAVSELPTTVAIVTVTGVSGVLALENSWIHTKFVATVDEVLRTGKEVRPVDRVQVKQTIEFHVHGGEVAVNGVIVRARDVVNYPIGRKYLVFLGPRQYENGFSVDTSPLLIEGDRLSAVAPATSQFSGLTLSEVRRAVRESR